MRVPGPYLVGLCWLLIAVGYCSFVIASRPTALAGVQRFSAKSHHVVMLSRGRTFKRRSISPAMARVQSPVSDDSADLPNDALIRDRLTHRIFLLWAGTRYRLNSSATLAALGFAGSVVTAVEDSAIQAILEGENLHLRLAHGLVYPLSPIASGHARLSLSLPAAPPGNGITIEGTGYGANESVQVTFIGNTTTITTTTTGGFRFGLTIPSTSTVGSILRVYAIGLRSRFMQVEPISVIATVAAPTLILSAPIVPQGTSFQVSGSGFAPHENVDLFLAQGVSAQEVSTDDHGAFSNLVLPVPATLSARDHSLIAFGLTSKLLAESSVSVSGPSVIQPGLTFNRYIAGPDTLLLASGAGFAPDEPVRITFSGSLMATTHADHSGAFVDVAILVPISTPPETIEVAAFGVTSHRTALTSIRIALFAPALTLIPSAGTPGTTVAVQGSGYAPHEVLTLALNSLALVTSPVEVLTDAAGAFSAAFAIPASALAGENWVVATGASSHAIAPATLTVNLTNQSTWYFAGGNTGQGYSTRIALVNPTDRPAQVTCTFMFSFGTPIPYSMVVPPSSRANVDVNAIVGTGKQIFTKIIADRSIGAEETIFRPGQDFSSVIGVSAPLDTWYLAEGYTGSTFHQTLRIFNPGAIAATIDLQLLPFNGRPMTAVKKIVAPESGLVVDVNSITPHLSQSAVITSDVPVVVDRQMVFGSKGYGITEQAGIRTPANTWLFAEGSTLNNFETYLTVLNPNATKRATVVGTFFDQHGAVLGSDTTLVNPRHRGNIRLNDLLHSSSIATVLTSDVPIVAERPIYFGAPNSSTANTGGSDVFGRNGGAISWIFPEGETQGSFREFLLLQNPSTQSAQVQIRFYQMGRPPLEDRFLLAPRSRSTIDVLKDIPTLSPGLHSAQIVSLNGIPIIAEQSIFSDAFTKGDGAAGIAQ